MMSNFVKLIIISDINWTYYYQIDSGQEILTTVKSVKD